MELTSKTTIKALLRKYGIHPLKALGQNFLISKNVLEKIIEAANLKPDDIVLEIGPGIGTLTKELAHRVEKVVAVEKDRGMVEILKETLKEFDNVEIIEADILNFEVESLAVRVTKPISFSGDGYLTSKRNQSGPRYRNHNRFTSYKVVANLPYYITSPVIRKFLETDTPPKEMFLMVQKEVGQRICAKPPKMSLLAVSVQFYAGPEIISFVPKNCFWPRPKVDSAIIKLRVESRELGVDKDLFFKIVQAGFSQPRKQLINSLSSGLASNLSNGVELNKVKIKEWLKNNGISPTRRAETLSVQDWIKLTKSISIE